VKQALISCRSEVDKDKGNETVKDNKTGYQQGNGLS